MDLTNASPIDERGEVLDREVDSGSLYVSTDCMDEDTIAKAVKAATVAERLEIVHAEGPFDVAIVDLMLPDGDGTVRDLSETLGKAVPPPEKLTPGPVVGVQRLLQSLGTAGAPRGVPLEPPGMLRRPRRKVEQAVSPRVRPGATPVSLSEGGRAKPVRDASA